MKRVLTVVCGLMVAIFLAVSASARMNKEKRTAVQLTDIPRSAFEIIRYTSPTKSIAITLDVPDDGIAVIVYTGYQNKEILGTTTPQRYFDDFRDTPYVYRTPHVYRFEDKDTGELLGFILISARLRFLSRYNKRQNTVKIQLEDPDYIPND